MQARLFNLFTARLQIYLLPLFFGLFLVSLKHFFIAERHSGHFCAH